MIIKFLTEFGLRERPETWLPEVKATTGIPTILFVCPDQFRLQLSQ